MRVTERGRAFGLPKDLVAAMLGVALVVTVTVDLSGAPAARRAAPPAAGHIVAGATVPSSTSTAPTVPPTTTTAPVPTTLAPPPPPPAPRRAAPRAVSHPSPKPVAHPAPVAPPRSAGTVGFTAYVGGGNASGLSSFAAATGTHPGYASDFLPGNGGWVGMTSASSLAWLTNAWRSTGRVLILGVPMIPTDSSGAAQGSLAGGAAGQYNAAFTTLAATLVAGGEGNAELRVGWEFNGNWFPWSVANATDAANFAAYFRNIVNAMRAVPGQSFKFIWNPNVGDSTDASYTPAQAYPGSAYVDFIGGDLYDQTWVSPATPQNAWVGQLGGEWGLDFLASFASSQGRPVVFPEWGVLIRPDGHGMGDDPYFIDQFGAWIVAHNVAWTSYFNFDASNLLGASFPQSLAAFRQVFG